MDIASVEVVVAKVSEITHGLTVDQSKRISLVIADHVQYVARPLRNEIGDLLDLLEQERVNNQ